LAESVSGKSALAQALFRVGAVRFGKLTTPSGRTSSFHLDLAVVPSDPGAFGLAIAACRVMAESLGVDHLDALAGLGVTGTALASPLSYLLKKPLLCQKQEAKGQTHGWTVEGASRPRWRTAVVSDEVVTGRGIALAVQTLRKTGCLVKDALALVDRQEGGRATLAACGVVLTSFTDVRELAVSLFESKIITKTNYEMALKQLEGQV